MKIEGNFSQNAYSANCRMASSPSFKAVHPTRYFLRLDNGSFVQVTDGNLIRTLQRRLITWLNKSEILWHQTPANKPLTKASEKEHSLKVRLIRFFMSNDVDYSQKRVVKSFYSDNRHTNTTDSYIFSGHQTEILDTYAKPIGRLKADIKNKIAVVCEENFLTPQEAKLKLSGKEDNDLMSAKINYYDTINKYLSRNDVKANPRNTIFDAYFVPVKKGKKADYQLYNAEFKRVML